MKINKQTTKKAVLPLLGLGAAMLIGVSAVSVAHAQGGSDQRVGIIERLVERFGLNQNEVEAVFEEERQERQQAMETKFIERLDESVADGRITEEQKQQIIDQHTWLQEQHQELRDLEPEARREKMEEFRQQMETWAEENGIEMQFLGGMGRGMGPGRVAKMDSKTDASE